MSKTVCFITRNFGKYDPDSLKGYESIGGFRALRKALTMEGCDIADVLAANGVQGRGGAAYDMGKKWRQAREVPGAHKCVVCNADEGEPGTFKDRELLTHDPFQLLEGMIIAGWAVGADNGYIYLREEYSHLRPRLLSAIAQCEAAGYLGDNILGSGLNYRIHLYSGAGAYVCGEGSALAESIGGHAGRPRMKPPFIKQCGVFHLPTCVNNVESLSLVAPLLLDDEGYYKSQGTPDCPGTKMISVSGNVKHPGCSRCPSASPSGRSSMIWPAAWRTRTTPCAWCSLAARRAASAPPPNWTPPTPTRACVRRISPPSAPARCWWWMNAPASSAFCA